MANTDPTKFAVSSDFALLGNFGSIELTINIPAGSVIPANGQLAFTASRAVPQETAQYVMGKVFSSLNPNASLSTTGSNAGNFVRFDRTTYYIAFLVVSSTNLVTVYVYVQNRRSDISQNTGAAETITFQLRPMGRLF